MAGRYSNSNYSILGDLRAVVLTISNEVRLALILGIIMHFDLRKFQNEQAKRLFN